MKRARSCENDSDELEELSFNKRILSDKFNLLKITSSGSDVGDNIDFVPFGGQSTSVAEFSQYPPPNVNNLQSNFSCGRYKYARKVDYLIDNLIRKSRKTFCHSDEREIKIPNSIGPQPTTDRALSLYRESSIIAAALRLDREKIVPSAASLRPTKCTVQSVPSTKNSSYAGDNSHGDWGIEEIAVEKEGDAEEKMVCSSDEYCIDSEEDRSVEDIDIADVRHSDMEVATW